MTLDDFFCNVIVSVVGVNRGGLTDRSESPKKSKKRRGKKMLAIKVIRNEKISIIYGRGLRKIRVVYWNGR